ncbi:MAG: hypothetical protein ACTSO9_08985 [Candidatus Helarchaeota archaeon]
MYVSNYNFTPKRVIIFGINNYVGPDIGVVIWRIVQAFGVPDPLAYDMTILTIHSAYGWPVFSLLLALIYCHLTRYNVIKTEEWKPEIIKLEEPTIRYIDCYKLIVAGGLLHLHLDWLFHPNTPEYVAIMATGNFEQPFQPWTAPPIHWSMLITGIIMLSFGYFLIWIFAVKRWHKKEKFLNSVKLFIGYTILYLIWLGAWILATGDPLPVGEESDFGQIIFYAITFFIPLILVATSFERPEFMKNTNT